MPKKETVSFRAVVAPNTSQQFSQEITGDATIEGVRIRFYPGQQKLLQVNPYIIKRNEEHAPLIVYPANTNAFLSGDDDHLEFPVGMPVELKDKIVIDTKNTDTVNSLTVVVDVVVDYYGGKNRVV